MEVAEKDFKDLDLRQLRVSNSSVSSLMEVWKLIGLRGALAVLKNGWMMLSTSID